MNINLPDFPVSADNTPWGRHFLVKTISEWVQGQDLNVLRKGADALYAKADDMTALIADHVLKDSPDPYSFIMGAHGDSALVAELHAARFRILEAQRLAARINEELHRRSHRRYVAEREAEGFTMGQKVRLVEVLPKGSNREPQSAEVFWASAQTFQDARSGYYVTRPVFTAVKKDGTASKREAKIGFIGPRRWVQP